MDRNLIFKLKTDITKTSIPVKLNNPFGAYIPEIAKIAAKEFQEFIGAESKGWKNDYEGQSGKMFGALVVQEEDKVISYLGTVSGKLDGGSTCSKFIPSIFDESAGDNFISKGLIEVTQIGNQIKAATDQSEINSLKEKRKQRSIGLQKRLFENYNFLNLSGQQKNVLEIFKNSSHGNPPSASGECAAPKLLQYAIRHRLRPIALAEFWWGNPSKNGEKKQNVFYPACKDRCRPILEYMLEDTGLYDSRSQALAKNEDHSN